MPDTHTFVEYTSELGKVLNNVRNYVPTTDITTDKKNNAGRIIVTEEEANARIVGMFDTRLYQDSETGKWYVEIYDSSETPYDSQLAGFIRWPTGAFIDIPVKSVEIDFSYDKRCIYLLISWNGNSYTFSLIAGNFGHNDNLGLVSNSSGDEMLPRTYSIPLAWWSRVNPSPYTAILHPLRMPGYVEVHDRWI